MVSCKILFYIKIFIKLVRSSSLVKEWEWVVESPKFKSGYNLMYKKKIYSIFYIWKVFGFRFLKMQIICLPVHFNLFYRQNTETFLTVLIYSSNQHSIILCSKITKFRYTTLCFIIAITSYVFSLF